MQSMQRVLNTWSIGTGTLLPLRKFYTEQMFALLHPLLQRSSEASHAFFKIKLKLRENLPNEAAFMCPAAKLYTFFPFV